MKNSRKIKKYLFISLMVIFSFCFPKTIDERLNEIKKDSLKVNDLIGTMLTDIGKENLQELLDKLEESKKLFEPFPVDIYRLQGIRFKFKEKKYLTIEELIDLLTEMISRSKIIRINKLRFQNGSGKANLADNTYKELDKYPEYKDTNLLRKILETTVLNSERKSSIEWIWGRSYENDAYFSTKLTVFDKQFTLYPNYRVFVGKNSYRDKKSWFYSLESYQPAIAGQQVMKAENIAEINTSDSLDIAMLETSTRKNENISPENENLDIVAIKEFTCGSDNDFEYDVMKDEITLNADIYSKDKYNNYVSKRVDNVFLKAFVKGQLSGTQSISAIKFSKTDFIIKDDNVKKLSEEEYIEITDDVRICSERIKSFFAEALLFPDKKRSIELITGRNKSKLSYFATIITIYDGQITVFYDYKVAAPSVYRKDKGSWYNRLVVRD